MAIEPAAILRKTSGNDQTRLKNGPASIRRQSAKGTVNPSDMPMTICRRSFSPGIENGFHDDADDPAPPVRISRAVRLSLLGKIGSGTIIQMLSGAACGLAGQRLLHLAGPR